MQGNELSEKEPKTMRLQPLFRKESRNDQQYQMIDPKNSLHGRFRLTKNHQRLKIKTEPTGSCFQMEFQKRQDKNINRFSQEYLALVNKLKVNLSKQYFQRKKSRNFSKERAHYCSDVEKRKFSARQPSPQQYLNHNLHSRDSFGKKQSAFSLHSQEDATLRENSLLKLSEQNKKNIKSLHHYSQQKLFSQGQNLMKIREKNETQQTIKHHQKKLMGLKQQRRRLLQKQPKTVIQIQQKQNLPHREFPLVNINYNKVDELCFHVQILLDIYDSCSTIELIEIDLLKKLKNYVLGNRKMIEEQQFRVITDDISHLQTIVNGDDNRRQLRTLIFMQRILIVLTVDLIANSKLQRCLPQIKQVLQSMHGLYLYFLYQLRQKQQSPFTQSSMILIQKRVQRYNIHFKKQIKALNIFITKKLFPIMKNNATLSAQIKIIMVQFQNRNVSINRGFYQLLKLYAIYLNNHQHVVERNYKEIKSFATCPSPYLTAPNRKEYTLVLDLDQTLVHTHCQNNKMEIFIRPYAKEFLTTLGKHYQLVIFTSSLPSYAEDIISALPPIDYSLFRHHTTRIKHKHIKDLSRLGRPLQRIVIVDNEEDNFALQQANGIKIPEWKGDDPHDQQLNIIGLFLMKLAEERASDTREYLEGYKKFRNQYA